MIATGGVKKFRRWVWKIIGKYTPHQNKREKERRVKQISRGTLKKENGLI